MCAISVQGYTLDPVLGFLLYGTASQAQRCLSFSCVFALRDISSVYASETVYPGATNGTKTGAEWSSANERLGDVVAAAVLVWW
jgi:hypothetical protein